MKIKWTILKIILSVTILYFVLHGLDFDLLIKILSAANPFIVLFVFCLFFISLLLMAAKWQIFIKRYSDLSFRRLVALYWAADFMNLFFLGVIGSEIYKAYHIKNKKAVILSSVLDRIYSMCIYLYVGLIIYLMIFSPWLVIALPGLLVIIIYFYPKLITILQKVKYLGFLKYGLQTRIDFAKHCLVSFLSLLTMSSFLWLSFAALQIKLSYVTFPLFTSILILLTSLPITFHGLGIREYLFINYANYFGIGINAAIGASIIVYSVEILYRALGIIPFYLNKKE